LENQSLLSVNSLTVKRNNISLFQDLSFELEIGQIALVLGSNGSGKTSLIRNLLGFNSPVEGSINWFTDSISYLGHNNSLNNELSVLETINFYLGLYSKSPSLLLNSDVIKDFANEFLDLNKIKNRKIKNLSVGQQRKLAIYCSVLKQGSCWILDEPTANLDKQSIKVLLDFILFIKQENRFPFSSAGIILATHDHSLLEKESSLLIRL
tara:strand:+ start:4797 stop:5423 length:627 start_codon:yes stop_codon:yes gene_type:complete